MKRRGSHEGARPRHRRRQPARVLRRIGAMARKEVLHIVRDVRTLYMALGMPVVLIIIFGFAVSFDIEHVPIALVDQDRTAASRDLVSSLTASGEIVIVEHAADADAVDRLLRQGRAAAGLVIPPGLGDAIDRGDGTTLQLLVDGSDGTTANAVLGTVTAEIRSVSSRLMLEAIPAGAAGGASMPFVARVRLLYNPTLRSATFFVPGLVAFILALGAVLLTALTVAREWERGNMEQLFATPVSRVQIVLGKLLPYLVIGLVQALLVIVVGTMVFDVPIRGSLPLLGLATLVFMAGMLGQGLLISVVTRNQQVATQAGAISSFLPAILLSGFIFPVENMPLALRAFAEIFPARHFVTVLRGIMLKGSGFDALWPDLAAMTAFAFVVVVASTKRFRRTLG